MNCIDQIHSLLSNNNIDALILTSKENTSYVTGINDFEGFIFVCNREKAICFTDSRYIEIAEIKSKERGFEAFTTADNNYPKEISKLWLIHANSCAFGAHRYTHLFALKRSQRESDITILSL